MSLRIAIPEPSTDTEYNQRSLPSYLAALHSVGATVVLVPLHERPDRVAKLLTSTQGLLLPGSRFDVDPHQYGETPIPACGPADPARTVLDELLLGDAFHLHKPIFGICHGTQTINVWRNGALIQDLPSVLHTPIDHSPGRAITDAHPIRITPGSRLATIARSAHDPTAPKANSPSDHSPGRAITDAHPIRITPDSRLATIARSAHDPSAPKANSPSAELVNSSHHQAVGTLGNNLRITAVSPDNVIEAIELDAPDHWVVAVQWHPERTYTTSALSRSLFAAFIQAVAAWQPHRVEESVSAT